MTFWNSCWNEHLKHGSDWFLTLFLKVLQIHFDFSALLTQVTNGSTRCEIENTNAWLLSLDLNCFWQLSTLVILCPVRIVGFYKLEVKTTNAAGGLAEPFFFSQGGIRVNDEVQAKQKEFALVWPPTYFTFLLYFYAPFSLIFFYTHSHTHTCTPTHKPSKTKQQQQQQKTQQKLYIVSYIARSWYVEWVNNI